MDISIYNGNQIGGCITTITSNSGKKICIDIGENLPTINKTNQEELKIQGLTYGKKQYEAVIVTHYHGDHLGNYKKVLLEIPIYIGEISKKIYKILQKRLVNAKITNEKVLKIIDNFKTYKIPEKIKLEDFVITPIAVDHSAFDAYMLLIEVDGKRILYTGDFRLHGQRGKKVILALEKYVKKVDCIICEGTMLSRVNEQVITERELGYKAEKIFRENKYSFVMCSSTNIDRIASFHKATLNANRLFVCDNYQNEILEYIDLNSRSSLYKFKNKVLSYGENILELMKKKGFVMLVRDNFISRKAIEEFPKNIFIYSEWKGYLNKEFKQYESLQKFVPENYKYLHTSGHANLSAIRKVCETVKPDYLIPIHSESPEEFYNMDLKCQIIKSSNNKIIKI